MNKFPDRDECVQLLQPCVTALARILTQDEAPHDKSRGRHNKRVLELYLMLVDRIREVESRGR